MAVLLPFVTAMLLGRAIDLRDYRIGGVVYSDEKYTEENVNELYARYCVGLTTCLDPVVPLDMMLRVKSGFMSTSSGSMGLDGLLKDSRKVQNSITSCATVLHKTVTRSIPENENPIAQWQERVPSDSTHYTKAVHYANWFVVLNRLECDIPDDMPVVADILNKTIGECGPVDNAFPDMWNKFRKALEQAPLRGAVKEVVSIYSSSPISTSMVNPEEVLIAINELVGLLRDEGAIGEPLLMELAAIRDLDPKFPEVTKNVDEDVQKDLLQLNEMLDDVLDTRPKMTAWIRDMTESLDDDESEKIAVVLSDMGEVERILYDTITKISYYGSIDQKRLEKAIRIYEMGLPEGKTNYRQVFLEMKETIGASCKDEFVKMGKGLLKVADEEQEGGSTGKEVECDLSGCQEWCSRVAKCRAVAYGESLSVRDPTSGTFTESPSRCWLFYRSTATAPMRTPTDVRGNIYVYNRVCD